MFQETLFAFVGTFTMFGMRPVLFQLHYRNVNHLHFFIKAKRYVPNFLIIDTNYNYGDIFLREIFSLSDALHLLHQDCAR